MIKVKRKETNDRNLFVRITGINDKFIKADMKRLNFKCKTDYINARFDALRQKQKEPNARKAG